jgi:anthranilate phosphoribosyltransferase
MSETKSEDEVIAFLLLLTVGERTEELLDELRKMKEVVEGYIIYGEWDILIKVKIKNLPELTEIVMNLRKKEGIKKTSTLIALAS